MIRTTLQFPLPALLAIITMTAYYYHTTTNNNNNNVMIVGAYQHQQHHHSLSKPMTMMSFGGHCTRCGIKHTLPTTDEARRAAVGLRDRMVRSGRMDIDELPVEHRERLLAGEITCREDGDDGDDPAFDLNPALATERLYERRGKMFGVLVCHEAPVTEEEDDDDATGSANATATAVRKNNSMNDNDCDHHHHHPPRTNVVILKAYAGKLGGQWNLPGWSPIIGKIPEDIPEFQRRSDEVSQFFMDIDVLKRDDRLAISSSSSSSSSSGDDGTTTINNSNDALIRKLTKERAIASTLAMQEVRKHQLVTNFRGETQPITVAFAKVGPASSSSSRSRIDPTTRNLPGGTGDCAAPKLLAEAVRRGLRPVGICEIFVGATGGMSTTKGDGEFYDACGSRCEHIAGYMLCGLE